MTRRCLILVLITIILAQIAVAADLTEDQRSEQAELLAWARTLRYQGRVDQAVGVCDMILSADPSAVDAWNEHGVLALTRGRFVVAQEDFIHALAHSPDNPMALVGRAHAHQAMGDTESAALGARKALDRCNYMIDVGTADAQTWYVRGLARLLLKDQRALQDFATALSIDPTHMDARGERAHLFRAQKRLDAAIAELDRAVEIRPDYAVGYLARGRMKYESGDLEGSIADCDRALEVNAEYAQAWHNRGLVNIEKRDFEAAIHDLTQAIAVSPDYPSAYVYRGQANLAAGNTDAARADWEKTKELDPQGWAGQAATEMLAKLQQPETEAGPAAADAGG